MEKGEREMRDIVIIGAGPAGLAAAIACRQYDLSVVVLDEFPKAGGRLLGQLHEEPNGEWWNGVKETTEMLQEAKTLQTDIRLGISVHHIEKNEASFIVHTNNGTIKTQNVLIATGATESAAPISGWTLPGVMSIGAAQVMTNVHRVKVGEKGIVVGVNVLSAAIARELQLAGVHLHSMALPVMNAVSEEEANPRKVMEKLVRIAHLAPSAFIKFGSKFAKFKFVQNIAIQFFPKSGVKMWDMPIHLRKAIKEINGTDKVESVTMVNVSADGEIITGSEEIIPVDFVCIAGGLYPLAELAATVDCPFQYAEELGGHVPVHNEQMETPIEGVFVAGNITGIESAKVAREQGFVAGHSIAKRVLKDESINVALNRATEKVRETRNNATIQFHPGITAGRNKVSTTYHEIVK